MRESQLLCFGDSRTFLQFIHLTLLCGLVDLFQVYLQGLKLG